jgi:hypothetical protein
MTHDRNPHDGSSQRALTPEERLHALVGDGLDGVAVTPEEKAAAKLTAHALGELSPEEAAEIERRLRERPRLGKTVQHPRDPCMAGEQRRRLLFRQTRVNDHGQSQATRKLELTVKALALRVASVGVLRVQEVEPCFADGNHGRLRRERLDPVEVVVCNVGMLPDARPDIRMRSRQLKHLPDALALNTNTEKPADARQPRAVERRLGMIEQIQMTMGVDEHAGATFRGFAP